MDTGYIYLFRNNLNNKCYVGQTVDFESRLAQHLYSAEHDSSCHIHRAIRKYGIENFSVSILEEPKISELDEREIFWIKNYDSYNSGYNMTLGGEGNRGYKMTEIDKKKISEASKKNWANPEYREKVISALTGQVRDQEFKNRLSKIMSGRPGRVWTEEQKKKLSSRNKGRVVSEETKKKLSESNKGQVPWSKGKPGSMLGKHHSEETKQKMSDAKKGRAPNNKGKPRSSEAIRKTQEAFRKRRELKENSRFE